MGDPSLLSPYGGSYMGTGQACVALECCTQPDKTSTQPDILFRKKKVGVVSISSFFFTYTKTANTNTFIFVAGVIFFEILVTSL